MESTFEALVMIIIITLVFTLPLTIFWMVVGWRAVRAHEKLADSVEGLARQNSRQEPQSGSLEDD